MPTVTSTITVPDVRPVVDVNVGVDITHPFDGAVDIFVSHAAVTVELSTGNGGSGDNFTDTVFDDEAGTPITDGSPPFTGTFQPEGTLSDFDGLDASGDWVLTVTDDLPSFDDGTLNDWQLVIQTTPDCNTNGIPDECDLADGPSVDLNTNAVPDDCEAPVVNLTQATFHATIADAMAAANDGDEVRAVPSRFVAESVIAYLGKEVFLSSFGAIDQPAGGSIVLPDDSGLAAAAGEDITRFIS